MEQQKLAYLLDRYADNTITSEEEKEFLEYLQTNPGSELAEDVGDAFLLANQHIKTNLKPYRDIAANIVVADRVPRMKAQQRLLFRIFPVRVRAAAAAILLVLAAGSYLWQRPKKAPAGQPQAVADIAPARYGAMLTRSNGQQLLLDSIHTGRISEEEGTDLVFDKDNLSYQGGGVGDRLVYNTITTPRGRTFHLTLQDGTGVWLNAGSSITYPVAFTGKERNVRISGEVYFEVAKLAGQPFIVDINGKANVQVLGTHFNINAYGDEPFIETTLLEGAVKVSRNIQQAVDNTILKPGQQARITENRMMTVDEVQLNEVMAWRNGLFHFSNATVPQIMRQLARWYDVEVRFEGTPPVRTFSGEIGRDLSLQQVLAILKSMRINYTVNNKQLTITD
ncbi:FecR family protein [Chitinophaga tropicalis]|uniref:DUF4974 domain-containing protein n=1 Tax=Chitinophaga tropicalis TaxID=2683588 RepID=A0A7K1U7L8_9BACT|nr:FecR family protein [Chitinophaga tropicalis]MVT10349.1 DUF4974 domain-containing protein [Chitinophaga tropicalis]